MEKGILWWEASLPTSIRSAPSGIMDRIAGETSRS